jgi:hypothetical protein
MEAQAGRAQAGGGNTLGEIVPAMLETVPYVGRLVGTLAHVALEESQQAQIERCLIAAMRIDDLEHKRQILNRLHLPFSKRGAVNAAQRQAALDLAGDVDLMAVALPPVEDRPGDYGDRAAPPRQQVPTSTRELALFIYKTARTELDDALNEETFVSWANRLAGALTTIANQRWEALQKGDDEAEREQWARLVMNDREAKPREVSRAALLAFGQRVGLRFEVGLVRNPALAPIVARLDHCDRQRAEISMLAAAHGVRRAILLLLLAAAALLVVLVGEAGAGHLALDLIEDL